MQHLRHKQKLGDIVAACLAMSSVELLVFAAAKVAFSDAKKMTPPHPSPPQFARLNAELERL